MKGNQSYFKFCQKIEEMESARCLENDNSNLTEKKGNADVLASIFVFMLKKAFQK